MATASKNGREATTSGSNPWSGIIKQLHDAIAGKERKFVVEGTSPSACRKSVIVDSATGNAVPAESTGTASGGHATSSVSSSSSSSFSCYPVWREFFLLPSMEVEAQALYRLLEDVVAADSAHVISKARRKYLLVYLLERVLRGLLEARVGRLDRLRLLRVEALERPDGPLRRGRVERRLARFSGRRRRRALERREGVGQPRRDQR